MSEYGLIYERIAATKIVNRARPFNAGDVLTTRDGDTRRVVSWNIEHGTVDAMNTRGQMVCVPWGSAMHAFHRTKLARTVD